MEKKQRFKKCSKKLIIDLNKKFHPKTPPVTTQQKWQPFGPFPCVLPPPSRSTSSVPAKNLVFGDLQPFRGAPPTAASGGDPAAADVNCPPRGFSLDQQPLNYGDDSAALKTLPLLPTSSSWEKCEIPSPHQLAPSTMTIFYDGGVSAFHDISPEKVELVLGMAGKSNDRGDMNEVIGNRSEEIERKRWNENPSCVYATDESSTAPSSSSGSFYQIFAPGAIAMARKATLARFLEKRKHRLIHSRKTYLADLCL